jgi:hypothetical protein
MSKNSKRSIHTAYIEYQVSYDKEHHGISPSLVDRGANGGVTGNDIRIIFKTNQTVDIKGIDIHRCTNINIGTVGGVSRLIKDPLLVLSTNMPFLTKDLLYTHLAKLSGIKMMLTINPFWFQAVSSAYRH